VRTQKEQETQVSGPKIKRIKCRTCGRSFNVKKTDINTVVKECMLTNCDLKGKDQMEVIRKLDARTIPLNPQDSIELDIPDPIVINVDANGRNIR
jgi:hypothetical protein